MPGVPNNPAPLVRKLVSAECPNALRMRLGRTTAMLNILKYTYSVLIPQHLANIVISWSFLPGLR